MDAGALLSNVGSRARTIWKWPTANVGALLASAAPPTSAVRKPALPGSPTGAALSTGHPSRDAVLHIFTIGRYQVVVERKTGNAGRIVQFELAHQVGAMLFNGLDA